MTLSVSEQRALEEAADQLQQAAEAKKCWTCGCLRSTLAAVERVFPAGKRLPVLDAAVSLGRERLQESRYDCLGCKVCYPALAANALNGSYGDALDAATCPTDAPELREGWPPLAGSYTTLRYQAPVAICTLTDEALSEALAREAGAEVAIIGMMQTENLGIERLIQNVLANPNIRFLIVCGADSEQAIGHLPGQSIVTLARSGIDGRDRIVGAKGKRPRLRNITPEAVEHFRNTVEVVDLVGVSDCSEVLEGARRCVERSPGPAEPFDAARVVVAEQGYIPDRMTPDPAGYFVVYVDRVRGLLLLEHYAKDGLLDHVVEGRDAAQLYTPAVERGLLTRLDHAAYLGRELARAEHALHSGDAYVQDAAAELNMPDSDGSCGSSCATSCG